MNDMECVFVTGANGLLGTNLIMMLVEQGFAVKALVRRRTSFIKPTLNHLTLVEGDLSDVSKLSEVMSGCKYVVHIAANTSQALLRLNDYYATNVQGTQNIIDACKKNKVNKLVYVGTANTYGYGNLSQPGDERQPMKSPFTGSLYALSKKQAQDIVDKEAARLNISTISPTFMLGAYDTKPSSGKIILMALNKRFVLCPSGGKNFVHVVDVAKAIIKTLGVKTSGEKYIVGNANLSYRDFYQKVIVQNQQKTTLISVPDCLIRIIGMIGDFMRFFRIKTSVSSVNTKVLTITNYYTNKKACEKLLIHFTPIEKAIDDALGYLKR